MGKDENSIRIREQSDEMEIDLLDLMSYYLSKIKIIIVCFLVGALAAGLFTEYRITPKYTATAKMYMVSASEDSVINLQDLNLGTSLSADYAILMKIRPIAEDVIKNLGLTYTYEELMDMMDISAINGTRIIEIAVTSPSPQEAMDIANEMARQTMTYLPKVMETAAPNVAEWAILPQKQSSPSLKKNTAIGALLALVAALGILTAIYLLDDTFKSAEDIEKAFGVMPMCVISEVDFNDLGIESEKKKKKLFGRRKGE